jgi:hypothetical protein
MSPTVEHEGVIALFRYRPQLAFELLRREHLPPPTAVTVLEADASQLVATEARADLVLVTGEGPAAHGLIVEVQRAVDDDKQFTWPLYITALRARHRHDFALLVVTLSDRVRAWAQAAISTGHPGFDLVPAVVGPDDVPRVTDAATAAAQPELAVLSALTHRADPAVGRAAFAAAAGLDAERSRLYADLIVTALGALAPKILEDLMDQGYTYQSDFAKKYVAQGVEQGALRSLRTTLSERFPRTNFDELLDRLAAHPLSDDGWVTAQRTAVRAKDAKAAHAGLEALLR